MFKINNVANTAFKAKLLDRQINSNEVITIDDWLDGAIQPTFVRQQEKFKEITMVVLIEGSNEEYYKGRNYEMAPEIDGLIYVTKKKTLKKGDIIKVKITNVMEYDLVGDVWDESSK